MDNPKRYNNMENVLIRINSEVIALSEDELTRNNKTLDLLLNGLVDKLKQRSPMFSRMYTSIYFGGSYYDGLRVGAPDEYDLDILLTLPKNSQPVLLNANKPGFQFVQLKNVEAFMKLPQAVDYKGFEKLLDKQGYLSTDNVLRWMEGLVQQALNDLGHSVDGYKLVMAKGGPALTLRATKTNAKIDIDLVPCIVFGGDQWPEKKYRKNPYPVKKPRFFLVPKQPKGMDKTTTPIIPRYWRLSFQEQEGQLINGKQRLKPTIKLLKKLRDNLEHDIVASYYLKTLVLWIDEQQGSDFWGKPLAYCFMHALKEYQKALESGKIDYFWNENCNLLEGMNADTCRSFSGRVKSIIDHVEKSDDPEVIASYLIKKKKAK